MLSNFSPTMNRDLTAHLSKNPGAPKEGDRLEALQDQQIQSRVGKWKSALRAEGLD